MSEHKLCEPADLHLQIFEASNAVVVFLCGFLNFALLEQLVALLVDMRHKLKFLLIRHSPHVELKRPRGKDLDGAED